MSTIKKIIDFFTCELAIDLGTSNTIIIDKERGVVVDEPSVVVVQEQHGRQTVIAVGNEAYSMIGKVPRNHKVIYPLEKGVVSNFDVAGAMLTYFFEMAMKNHPNKIYKPNPKVCITVPIGATQVEQRSVKELILRCGASQVETIEQSLAAGIGAGLNIEDNSGNLIVHMGAGVTEIVVLSMSDVVFHKTLDIGGNSITQGIIDYFRYSEKIAMTFSDAERVKVELADLNYKPSEEEEDSLNLTVVNKVVNTPKQFKVTKREVYKAIIEKHVEIVKEVISILEKCSPELAKDIFNNGIHISGSAAKTTNINKLFENITTIKTKICDNPEYVAVNGCLEYLE